MTPVAERLSDEKIAGMLAAAEKATPGPWVPGSWSGRCLKPEHTGRHPGRDGDNPCVYTPELCEGDDGIAAINGGTVVGSTYDGASIGKDNADHIANCDPQTATALLTELQHRREAEAGETIQWRGGHGGLWPDALGAAADALAEFEGGIDVHSDADARAALVIRAYIGAQPALASPPSSPATGVRVSKLEWIDNAAETPFGAYWLVTLSSGFVASSNIKGGIGMRLGDEKLRHATAEAARSACQADYDARILSAIREQS